MDNYAVILAAGVGSRLLPITDAMPKSLVRVNGREIIDYQIKGYLSSGIKEENITVVTGYMSDKIAEFLVRHYPQVNVVESINYKTTNNMYSLYLALKTLYEKNSFNFGTLFINNADCLYDEKLMNEFARSSIDNAIATEIGTYIEESMKIVLDAARGNIVNIAKTIMPEDAAGVSVDLYKYSAEAVKQLYDIVCDFIEIKKDLKQWTEVAFPELFKRVDVFPFDIKHKKWVEVDNNDDLLLADKLFSDFDAASKKAYVCDLDGTLFVGSTPIKPAIDFVKKYKDRFDFYFLTNNTSRTPEDYVKKLASAGITAQSEQIATPLYPLADHIKAKGYKSVYLVANDKVRNFMAANLPNVSFEFDLDKNEAVILTYDTELTYEKLKNMAVLLNNKNVEYIATHNDVFCPNEQGPIPDIGSIISLMKTANGFEPNIILGKPSAALINRYIQQYGADKVVVVGDRLYTDKKLADNAGCDFICVLSGETRRVDVAKDNSRHPALVVSNLGETKVSEYLTPPIK